MSREQCLDCNSTTGLAEYDDGTYCHACHTLSNQKSFKSKNKRKQTQLELPEVDSFYRSSEKNFLLWPQEATWYLSKYDITEEDINRYLLFWSNKYKRLVVPYYSQDEYIGAWMRDCSGKSKTKWLYAGNPKDSYVWLYKATKSLNENAVCVVEDSISAVKVSKYIDCICLGGTNVNSEALLETLLKYDTLISFFDGDEAGRVASNKFVNQFQILRTIRQIRATKDPKEYNEAELYEVLL